MALSEAESQAAAAVTAAFVDDFTGAAGLSVEAPAAESSSDVDDTDDPDVPAVAPSFTPEIPEDVLREIDEADIDDEVEQTIASRAPEDEGEYGYETEDETRERIRLQKRNDYLERELAKTKQAAWADEAQKYFPLAKHALGTIQATSRRAFLKQAKAVHDQVLPHVQGALAEAKGFVDQERDSAKAAGRQAAAAAFGTPIEGPDVHAATQAASDNDLQQARADARKTGSLTGLFKTMIQQGR